MAGLFDPCLVLGFVSIWYSNMCLSGQKFVCPLRLVPSFYLKDYGYLLLQVTNLGLTIDYLDYVLYLYVRHFPYKVPQNYFKKFNILGETLVSRSQTGNIQKYWVWHTSGTELFREAMQVLPQLTTFLSQMLHWNCCYGREVLGSLLQP